MECTSAASRLGVEPDCHTHGESSWRRQTCRCRSGSISGSDARSPLGGLFDNAAAEGHDRPDRFGRRSTSVWARNPHIRHVRDRYHHPHRGRRLVTWPVQITSPRIADLNPPQQLYLIPPGVLVVFQGRGDHLVRHDKKPDPPPLVLLQTCVRIA